MQILENFPLEDLCTFRIGGKAQYLINCKTEDDLIGAINFAKDKKLPIFVFGGGTNLLFPDEDLQAVVLRVQNSSIVCNNNLLTVGAGTNWAQLLKFCKDNNLYGLEAFSGLPGTIGGAIFGNAGAHGVEMKDVLKSVKVYDVPSRNFKTILVKNLDFDYRTSSFKNNLHYIIWEAELVVYPDQAHNTGDPVKFAEFRKEYQPQGLTTGSFFKNPKGLFAGKLIEDAELKGYQIGGVMTSPKHANFFINLGDATAKDVLSLRDEIIATVKQKFAVDLSPEVQVITPNRLINID